MSTDRRARYRARTWQRWSIAAPCALSIGSLLGACQAVLDIDDYSFDGGVEQAPGLPLEPADGGTQGPNRPPPPDLDSGGSGDGQPDAATTVPPPALPRPVVVDAPDLLFGLAGSLTGGGPRTATCPGGVIQGLVFQFWTSTAVDPDRISYIWPLCNLLSPTTPSLASGASYDPAWLVSEPTDPFFADLRDNESIDALACPEGQYLVGIEGTYDQPVGPSVGFRSLGIRCAGLGSDVERSDVVHSALSSAGAAFAPAPGAIPFAQQCPEGRVGNQIDLRFGVWLDAVGLGCSVVRWPFTAGHACSAPDQCQSDSCGADGVCAP